MYYKPSYPTLGLFNKNLILIGENFLYEFKKNMPRQCGLLDEA